LNNPTSTSGSGRCSAYFDAIRQAEDDVADALGHIRAEEDGGRITTVEAAAERVLHSGHHLATTTPIGGIQAGLAA
jgi:hypothetical protein